MQSFFLIIGILIILMIAFFVGAEKSSPYDIWCPLTIIGGVLSALGIVIVVTCTGCGDFFGETKTISTTDYQKALTQNGEKVIIMYENAPTVYDQYAIVKRFDSITNINVTLKKNCFGGIIQKTITIP